MGTLAIKQKKYKEAIIYYKKILSRDFMLGHYLYAKNQICDWKDYNENIAIIKNKINLNECCASGLQTLSFFDDGKRYNPSSDTDT